MELYRRSDVFGRGRVRIVSLLPVELILKVGSGAGFAMIFCSFGRGYFMESIDLVVWHSEFQLAYAHRIDYGRGSGKPVHGREFRHYGRRLGPSTRRREEPSFFPRLLGSSVQHCFWF